MYWSKLNNAIQNKNFLKGIVIKGMEVQKHEKFGKKWIAWIGCSTISEVSFLIFKKMNYMSSYLEIRGVIHLRLTQT